MSPVMMQARASAESMISDVVRSASCSVCIAFERQRHDRAHLRGGGDDVLAELRIALLRHGGAADGAGRHGLFHFAELGFHERVDLAADLAAGRGEQAEQADVLGQMVADDARGNAHRRHAEVPGDRRPAPRAPARRARRRCRPRRPAWRRRGAAPPAGSARRGAAARRSTRRPCSRTWPARRAGRACGAAIGMSAPRSARSAIAARISWICRRKMRVRLPQHQQVAGLRDVLRGRAPVHPAAVRLADDAARAPRRAARSCGRCARRLRRCARGPCSSSRAARAMGSTASAGMMPSSACARASATSTSSQACQRFSSL